MGIDKDYKKQIDAIKNLTEAQGNLLGGLYDDLFGSGLKPREKTRKKVTDRPDKPVRPTEPAKPNRPSVSEEDALSHADDALKEVRELLRSDGMDRLKGKTGSGTYEETAEATEATAEQAPKEPEKDPEEQLAELIGLKSIKHDVKELADFVRIQKMRKDQGLKSVPVSLHLVFTGNPGTGKTTVARIIAALYKKIGVLSKGQLVEVDRSGLVAGYVGQTALKTQEAIKRAMGGVLFIDEAYALARKDDTFGQEAIDTILKAMEDSREDLVVIVAGYTGPMKTFIESNPGLKSRFNKYFEFPDYTIEELEKMFYQNCSRYDYVLEEEAKEPVKAMIIARKLFKSENFANGREVRNMFEEIITNQARRVAKMDNPTAEDMKMIKVEDLEDLEEDMNPEKPTETPEGKPQEEPTPEPPAETPDDQDQPDNSSETPDDTDQQDELSDN